MKKLLLILSLSLITTLTFAGTISEITAIANVNSNGSLSRWEYTSGIITINDKDGYVRVQLDDSDSFFIITDIYKIGHDTVIETRGKSNSPVYFRIHFEQGTNLCYVFTDDDSFCFKLAFAFKVI